VKPIAAALGNDFTVGDDVELTGLAWRRNCVDVEASLDEGHETRDLRLVALSSRAIEDLDRHPVLDSLDVVTFSVLCRCHWSRYRAIATLPCNAHDDDFGLLLFRDLENDAIRLAREQPAARGRNIAATRS
jgi:hypothetical protein